MSEQKVAMPQGKINLEVSTSDESDVSQKESSDAMKAMEALEEAKAAEAKAIEEAAANAEPFTSSLDRIPSNWHIVAGKYKKTVDATNEVTGNTFSGPIREFNAKLRG
ncbi:MAG: hypothetical protein OEX12_00085 [Gammaproteobacteria bacterium]|nr:hypothetical protein [Gammaproteobacteria bacterium]